MSDAVEAAIVEFYKSAYEFSRKQFLDDAIRCALAAADKAREVTDEEVAKILRRFFSHFHGAMPDAIAQEAVAALHAAGMKVVRHEQ